MKTNRYSEQMLYEMGEALSKEKRQLMLLLQTRVRAAEAQLHSRNFPVVLTAKEQKLVDAAQRAMAKACVAFDAVQHVFELEQGVDSVGYTREHNRTMGRTLPPLKIKLHKTTQLRLSNARVDINNLFGGTVEALLLSEVNSTKDASTILTNFNKAVDAIVASVKTGGAK